MKTIKNTSLSGKLFGFVGLTSLLVLLALLTGGYYLVQIQQANALKEDVAKTVEMMLETRTAEKTYLQFFKTEQKQDFEKKTGEVKGQLQKLSLSTENENWKGRISSMVSLFEAYQNLFREIDGLHAQQTRLKGEMVKPLQSSEEALQKIQVDIETKQNQLQLQGDTLSSGEYEMLNVVRDCKDAFLRLQLYQLQYLLSGDQKFIDQYKKLATGNVNTYLTALNQFVSVLFKNQAWTKATSGIKESLQKFMGFIDQSQELYKKESDQLSSLNDSGAKILGTADSLLREVRESIDSQTSKAVKLVCAIVVVGLLFFWGLSFLLVRSINLPVRNAVKGLKEIAALVNTASEQVSSASQELAEGASEQAASIEETSSSLEEMSSMTKQNAENANQANLLMSKTREIVSQSGNSMEDLTQSMAAISKASEETSKIIKNIDEIAFQTNLLALNAAVEAARAGEAGAGFAVVADEVRNLAMRAADAAKNTANLIEGTVKRIKEGSGILEKTSSEFSQIQISVGKMGDLISEISAASGEQAQGIEQVSKAVSEMDKVVQRNSAGAEESASSSEELNAKARQLNTYIGELEAIVGGNTKAVQAAGKAESSKKPKPGQATYQLMDPHAAGASNRPAKRHDGGKTFEAERRTSEQVFPLSEGELQDF